MKLWTLGRRDGFGSSQGALCWRLSDSFGWLVAGRLDGLEPLCGLLGNRRSARHWKQPSRMNQRSPRVSAS